MASVGKWGWWIAIAAGVVCGGALGASAQSHRKAPIPAAAGKVTAAQIEAGKAFGVSTAPIRIDEYFDFECPHCQNLYLYTLRPLINDYVSSGKVYLVFHDFPLPGHTYARIAAEYGDAAAAIGRYSQVESALFLSQGDWAVSGKVEPIVAKALSATQAREVEALAESPVVKAAVQADVQRGEDLHVDETPTMFITHKGKRTPIVGAVSYGILRNYLNALLQQ